MATMEIELQERTLTESQQKFRKKMLNPWMFRFFTFLKLPAGWVAGMKVLELDTKHAVSSVPFKWLNQNPFRSMYFAVQSMAAELSTGALVLCAIEGIEPSIATLIVGMESEFTKKADKKVKFTCHEGDVVFNAVDKCIATGEPVTFKVKTVGTMPDGTVVANFYFTWSIKQRSQ